MSGFNKDAYTEYSGYILEQAKNLLSIDSPSGYGKEVMDYLMKELSRIGVKATKTVKGGVVDVEDKAATVCTYLQLFISTSK